MKQPHQQAHIKHRALPHEPLQSPWSRLIRNLGDSALVLLATLLMTIISTDTRAQGAGEPSYLGNSRYVEVSVGTGLGRLRDFATSPLYYTGPMQRIGGTLSRLGPARDISTGISSVTGTLKSDYNDHEAESSLKTFSVYHTRLYQIFKNGSDKWNFKAGGEANITGNLRVNQAFRNSAVGIEAFPILFGTFKATRDLTRATGRRGKEPKKKSLSLKINASIVSTSFRNGYSYLGIGQVIDKKGFSGLLDDYKFKMYGVNALSTSLDYTIWLKNKNGWRFSYAWDAYKTRNDYADFEMATHTLRVALLFNTKNN